MDCLGWFFGHTLVSGHADFGFVIGSCKLLFGAVDLAYLSILEFALLAITKKAENRADQQSDDVELPHLE